MKNAFLVACLLVSPCLGALVRTLPQRRRGAPLRMAVVEQTGNLRAVQRFFECWNLRDMESAVELFADDVIYEDTLYPEVFDGLDDLRFHLLRVADAVPDSFRFVVDDLSGTPTSASVGARVRPEGCESPAFRPGFTQEEVAPSAAPNLVSEAWAFEPLWRQPLHPMNPVNPSGGSGTSS